MAVPTRRYSYPLNEDSEILFVEYSQRLLRQKYATADIMTFWLLEMQPLHLHLVEKSDLQYPGQHLETKYY